MRADTGTRAALTRDRIVRAAVELADEQGIDALSMRRLGRRLGVEAMSLYNHVADKDDLLDGMVDLVYAEIELPSGRRGWRASLWRAARSARAALLRHRWAISLMESRASPGPANLRYHEAVLALLRRAGFSVEQAVLAFSTLDSYVYGFVLQELALPFGTHDELASLGERMLRDLADYPYLSETMAELLVKPGYTFADEFERWLDLVLDGIERRQLPSGQRTSTEENMAARATG